MDDYILLLSLLLLDIHDVVYEIFYKAKACEIADDSNNIKFQMLLFKS